MNTQNRIQEKLQAAFTPLHLEIIDESGNHNVPEGAQSHFRVTLVSPSFEGKSLITRHRQVNQILSDELRDHVHALALHTLTPEEWFSRGGTVRQSPECLGGSKQT
jgi:BolA protein